MLPGGEGNRLRGYRQPSQTAFAAAAAARAAHLVVDSEPFIFRDPVAMALLGDRADEMIGYHRAHGDHIVLSGTRAQATTRSRYTEQRLAELARRGLTQYVILGAGLDTFAYRSPPKRPSPPPSQRSVASRLAPSLWWSTPCRRLRDATGRAYAEFALAVAAERGEPWLTFLTPEQMSALLQANGLEGIEHVRQRDAIDPALWRRSDALRLADLCRLARAAVPLR